jgi:hypothetical protein
MTIATERPQPTGDTVITLAEQSQGPEALLKWFYPGTLTGNEFVYPTHEQRELAQDVQKTVVGGPEATNSVTQASN